MLGLEQIAACRYNAADNLTAAINSGGSTGDTP